MSSCSAEMQQQRRLEQQQQQQQQQEAGEEHFYALSQDGPMGFTNLLFIQSIVGCADAHPENEYCIAVVDAMKRIANERDGATGPTRSAKAKKCFTKEWAEFVQAVLDGKLRDTICETLLRGASIKPIECDDVDRDGQRAMFDFVLSSRAVDCVAETMPELHERFANVMQKMICNEQGAEEE